MKTGLVLDETKKHPAGARVHAIFIGVSDYTNLPTRDEPTKPGTFGLKKLTASASSATKLATWFLDHAGELAAPLATVRLLVAPTAAEAKTIGADARLKKRAPATLAKIKAAVQEWRDVQQPDDIAIFYFCGHGVQRNRADMVLLCSDFLAKGTTTLERAFDFMNVYDAHSREPMSATIAKTQVFLIDACRERPKAFDNFDKLVASVIFDAPGLRTTDDRRAPIIYATTEGSLAYADVEKATLFSRALHEGLDGRGAETDPETGDWQIGTKSLEEWLELQFDGTALDKQVCDNQHSLQDITLVPVLAKPPQCSVRLVIDPEAAVSVSEVKITEVNAGVEVDVPHPLAPHPFEQLIDAGIYTFSADIVPATAPYKRFQHARHVKPTQKTIVTIKVGP